MDFEEWWLRKGQYLDPVSMRKDLAAQAFAAAKAQSGNYVADDAVMPHKVTFANGRTVSVGGDGILSVGWKE